MVSFVFVFLLSFRRLLDLVFLFCFVIVHLLIASGLMKIIYLSTNSLYYSQVWLRFLIFLLLHYVDPNHKSILFKAF